MFASSGDTTEPCGVPTFVSDHWPCSDTPALSHFWTRRRMRLSATRCPTNFKAHSCERLSKEHTTDYPSSALPRTRHYHTSASSLRRPVFGGPPTGAVARQLAVRGLLARRQ